MIKINTSFASTLCDSVIVVVEPPLTVSVSNWKPVPLLTDVLIPKSLTSISADADGADVNVTVAPEVE